MNLNTSTSFTNSAFSGFIGVAEVDITPPVGIYVGNWGASTFDTASGIHHPMKLVCITFQESIQENPLILISADLGWWKDNQDEWFVRKEILKELVIDSSRLMFCLSHTHSGPSTYREDKSKPGGELIEPYLVMVKTAAIAAAKKALQNTAEATLTWKYGKCNLAANRDFIAENGGKMMVGFNPDAPADDTLLVGRISVNNNTGSNLATIVNYACHPTTLAWENKLISPDYVGAMREVVSADTSSPCLFLQGASGELAPAEQYVSDPEIVDRHGRQLGHAVLSTLFSMLPSETGLTFDGVVESGAPLAIWKPKKHKPENTLSVITEKVRLPLKDLPSQKEIEEKIRTCEDRVLKERLWRLRGIRKSFGDGDSVDVPLWVWRLGNSFLVGQQNELYAEFQLELRKNIPATIAVIGLVNGSGGYLVPTGLYTEKRYQVWQTPFGKGSSEHLQEVTLQTIQKMSL